MENIGGIFVVLVGGLVLAVLVALVEFVWASRRSAEREEVRGAMGGGCYGVSGGVVGHWGTLRGHWGTLWGAGATMGGIVGCGGT